MNQVKQILIFRSWVQDASAGTCFDNDKILQEYIVRACCGYINGLSFDKSIFIEFALQISMHGEYDPKKTRLVADCGLVQHVIFGDTVDQFVHQSMLAAYAHLSHSLYEVNHHTDRLLAYSFSDVNILLGNMRRDWGTGANLLIDV